VIAAAWVSSREYSGFLSLNRKPRLSIRQAGFSFDDAAMRLHRFYLFEELVDMLAERIGLFAQIGGDLQDFGRGRA